jgi:ketosteroid isomerase-like protein
VYHTIVRRRMRRVLDGLSAGDWQSAVALMDERVRHVVTGDSALGGERHTRDAVARWHERSRRLFSRIEFEVVELVSCGPPWRTTIAAAVVVHVTPAVGEPYENPGVEWFRLRWGRVTHHHDYIDGQVLSRALDALAEAGVAEAAAAPVADVEERPEPAAPLGYAT